MEKYIGKDFVFHDAEVDSVKINREGMVKVRLWTWSDVDYEKHFHADYTLYGCGMSVRCMIRPSAMCCDLKSLNGTLRL